jgi:NTE family protein
MMQEDSKDELMSAAQEPSSQIAETIEKDKYLPSPNKIPNSIGLALSGGGFRATLFHLGAIRRLHELRILPKLTTVSSVSGGSILNGFLASRLVNSLSKGISDFSSEIALPVRQFCSLDIRRWPALERLIPGLDNSLQLAHQYDEHLTKGKLLKDVPDTPNHLFCCTDLAYGVNWTFTKKECGDYQAGYMPPPNDWKVSTAVAASSCFPPVFKPMSLNLDPTNLKGGKATAGPVRDQCIKGITFTDGGVYDNLGLEPIWKNHEVVLSSDGGALFSIGGDIGFPWEIGRFISIPENQALAIRKRWLMASFLTNKLEGTYWGIGGYASKYGVNQGYSETLAKGYIATIRTDLDSFSEAEASILENHGYWLADAAIKTHVSRLYPSNAPPVKVPNPDWDCSEDKIERVLRQSSQRTILGRSVGRM